MKKLITAGLASVVLAIALVTAPSFAAPSDDIGADRAAQARAYADERRDNAQEKAEARRQAAEQRVSQIKQAVENRKAEIKQKVCEQRQDVLRKNISHMASSTTNVIKAFDAVYERVQGFYQSGQLTVANYEELKANVDNTQQQAAAAVVAVKDFNFELNCEDPAAAGQLDGFRQAVTEAKEALKTYRAELVTLISSMRAEAAAQNGQTNGNNDSDVNATPEEVSDGQ